MPLATLQVSGRTVPAMIDPDADVYWPLGDLTDDAPVDVRAWIEMAGQGAQLRPRGPGLPLSGTRFAPPLQPARDIICVGKNYHAHAEEFTRSGFDTSANGPAEAIPDAPIVFGKSRGAIIAAGEPIMVPEELTACVDYEAELAVIIGKRGRGISADDAMDHVFGYTIVNDVTARDLQARHKQWYIGKSIDSFCPMGPLIATRDELDLPATQVRCWINGELRQQAAVTDMIFDIPTLIATISAGMTLLPGDVIATGTPAGVGIGFDPPRYLRDGDEVAIEITGLGRLSNPVRRGVSG